MAKLKELIDQHRDQVPGLKVRRDHWEKFGWLEILDIRNGNAIGWNNYGGSTVQALDSATENWELYRPLGPAVRPPAHAAKSVYVQMLKPGTVLRVTEGGIEMETPGD